MNFDQLKLLPGTSLQLEFHQTSSHLKQASSLIGYVPNQCIIVSMPPLISESKPMLVGELVDVTLYSEELNCSILFSVQVLNLIDKPLAHAYLGFPVFIAKDEVRKAQRVTTSLIATIKSNSKSLAGKIIDLSISGCKLTSKEIMGQVDTKLLVVTKLSLDGTDKIIQLKGTIKSQLAIQKDDGELYEYGISFMEITGEQKASIQHYIDNV